MKLRIAWSAALALISIAYSASPATATGRMPGNLWNFLGWGYGPGYHAPMAPGTTWHPQCGPNGCSHGCLQGCNSSGLISSPSVLVSPPPTVFRVGEPTGSHGNLEPIRLLPANSLATQTQQFKRSSENLKPIRLPPVDPIATQANSMVGTEQHPIQRTPPIHNEASLPNIEPSFSDSDDLEETPPDISYNPSIDIFPTMEAPPSGEATGFQYRHPSTHLLPQ